MSEATIEKLHVNGPEELLALAGRELGPSRWVTIDQERIDTFARAVDDQEWIHVDVERAKAEGPFGNTIAHGLLLLALAPPLLHEHLEITGFRLSVNYGINKVRFPATVVEGSRVRVHFTIPEVTEVKGGYDVPIDFKVEIEGNGEKPAAAGQIVLRHLT